MRPQWTQSEVHKVLLRVTVFTILWSQAGLESAVQTSTAALLAQWLRYPRTVKGRIPNVLRSFFSEGWSLLEKHIK